MTPEDSVTDGTVPRRMQASASKQRLLSRPRTQAGRRAAALLAGGLALLALAVLLFSTIDPPSPVGVVGFLGAVAVAAGGVSAIIALARRGERSLVVVVAALAGLLAAFVVVGEFAFPH